MDLEFRREVWKEHRGLGAISLETVTEAMGVDQDHWGKGEVEHPSSHIT